MSNDDIEAAAERIRVILTDALNDRTTRTPTLHLLTGSKTAIRAAIAKEIRQHRDFTVIHEEGRSASA